MLHSRVQLCICTHKARCDAGLQFSHSRNEQHSFPFFYLPILQLPQHWASHNLSIHKYFTALGVDIWPCCSIQREAGLGKVLY